MNINFSANKIGKLSGWEAISSLALFFEQKNVLKKKHLVVASGKDIEKLKAFLRFKKPKIKWHDLPLFPEPKSPYSETARMKRRKWQAWASASQAGLFLAEPQALLKKTEPKAPCFWIKKESLFPSSCLRHYSQKVFVEKAGEFSSRSFLMDIFSPAYQEPLRIQLFGNKVQSIHLLDKNYKKRQKELEQALVPSPLEWSFKGEDRQKLCAYLKKQELSSGTALPPDVFKSFARGEIYFGFEHLFNCLNKKCSLDCFPDPPVIWLFEPERAKAHFLETSDRLAGEHPFFTMKNLFLPWSRIEKNIPSENSFIKESMDRQNPHVLTPFSSSLFKKGKSLKEDLNTLPVSHIVFTGNRLEELKKLLLRENILNSKDQDFFAGKSMIFLPHPIKESFFCKGETAYLRSEDFIFQKDRNLNSFEFFRQRSKALEFSNMEPGDLLVHRQYGVGKFAGLQPLKMAGREEDFIVLHYKDGDSLFVPAYRANQVKRYTKQRVDGITKILLDRLGKPKLWERKKLKAKKYIQSLAIELIELYRLRKQKKRRAFAPVKKMLESFAEDFPFEETEDQKRAIREIMSDMDGEQYMDRLLTADTGFGKTEVALRACFRALANGFQVCLLAPTTVLASQHFENFKQRFKKTNFCIDLLSRFTPSRQRENIFQKTKKGELDFLIATHSAFSPHLFFKNLGLIVIDEEHRFGVRQKERLLRFRKNLDVLSLSASPIPRTLNMALTGVKDISAMSRPPLKRKPVQMEMRGWDDSSTTQLIAQACKKEKARGGQILFVHNRVRSLPEKQEKLKQLLPDFRILSAHGKTKNLDKMMLDFFNKKYDLLLSTNIIELGMDIPKANTMFIDRVHEMGLSQIYQLKGRVGRSEEQAYCYLLFPAEDRLSALARERLGLLKKYAGLGSGFQLALHDLENRGAGSLFGAEQSGHLQSLGEDLYFEILNEQLKGEKHVFVEPEIYLPFPAGIPADYILDPRLRLLYYKNLSELSDKEARQAVQWELREEFGPLPPELESLFFLLEIRELCKTILIQDFRAQKQSLSLTFNENTSVPPDKLLKILDRKKGRMTSGQSCKIPLAGDDFFKEIMSLLKELENTVSKIK